MINSLENLELKELVNMKQAIEKAIKRYCGRCIDDPVYHRKIICIMKGKCPGFEGAK